MWLLECLRPRGQHQDVQQPALACAVDETFAPSPPSPSADTKGASKAQSNAPARKDTALSTGTEAAGVHFARGVSHGEASSAEPPEKSASAVSARPRSSSQQHPALCTALESLQMAGLTCAAHVSWCEPQQLVHDVHDLRWVGQGSQGVVYEGIWQGAVVAVKWSIVEVLDAGAYELLFSKLLGHPNVVQTYSAKVAILDHKIFEHDMPGHLRDGALLQRGDTADTSDAVLRRGDSFRSDEGFGSPVSRASSFADVRDMLRLIGAKPGQSITQMIMEYCDQGSLLTAISRGIFLPNSRFGAKVALRALYRTAREVAQGMTHLHQASVVHGDLKPANVLLMNSRKDRRGFVAKVSDFGLAQYCPASQGVVENAPWGTLVFMAPERFRTNRLEPASDIWSFGVLMWQMYTARSPYEGCKPAQLVHGVTRGTLSLMWPPGSPPALMRLVASCMARMPAQRPTFDTLMQVLAQMENDVRLEGLRQTHSLDLPGHSANAATPQAALRNSLDLHNAVHAAGGRLPFSASHQVHLPGPPFASDAHAAAQPAAAAMPPSGGDARPARAAAAPRSSEAPGQDDVAGGAQVDSAGLRRWTSAAAVLAAQHMEYIRSVAAAAPPAGAAASSAQQALHGAVPLARPPAGFHGAPAAAAAARGGGFTPKSAALLSPRGVFAQVAGQLQLSSGGGAPSSLAAQTGPLATSSTIGGGGSNGGGNNSVASTLDRYTGSGFPAGGMAFAGTTPYGSANASVMDRTVAAAAGAAVRRNSNLGPSGPSAGWQQAMPRGQWQQQDARQGSPELGDDGHRHADGGALNDVAVAGGGCKDGLGSAKRLVRSALHASVTSCEDLHAPPEPPQSAARSNNSAVACSLYAAASQQHTALAGVASKLHAKMADLHAAAAAGERGLVAASGLVPDDESRHELVIKESVAARSSVAACEALVGSEHDETGSWCSFLNTASPTVLERAAARQQQPQVSGVCTHT